MSFKKLLLCMVITMTGCSDFLKGKKSSDQVITVEENEACLKKFPETFDRFLESKIDGAEIDAALDCLNSTLTRFQSKFRGQQDKDVFSVEDVTTIFNFFFKDLKISKETSEKLIRFKYALIGGNSNTLSKVDVENLKEFLKDLSQELKGISKWVTVFRSDNGSIPESSIKSAFGQLRSSLINLINSGHISKTQYSVEDFILLLKQFNFNLKPYSEQIDQLLIVKKFLIGDDYVKSKESYIAAVELILDIMQLNAMIENKHFKFDLKNSATQKPLIDLINSALQIIKNSPRLKADGSLQLQTLKDLVNFDSPMLAFENLLTYKVVLLGGRRDLLTLAEVQHLEANAQKVVANYYKALMLFQIKSIEQLISVSPDLQLAISDIFDNTFLEQHLANSDFSQKIFDSLLAVLKAKQAEEPQKVNSAEIFLQIADAGTFVSKQNILGFLKAITESLKAAQSILALPKNAPVHSRLLIARDIISNLQNLLDLKTDGGLNIQSLLTNFGVSDEQIQDAIQMIGKLFPKLSLSKVTHQDLKRFYDLLHIAANEFNTLSNWPQNQSEMTVFKNALKTVLDSTDFYTTKIKTHELLTIVIRLAPKEWREMKGITDFLGTVIHDREVKEFSDIDSMIDSLFLASELAKKISSSKIGLESVQDFVQFLKSTDAIKNNKPLKITELLSHLQKMPQVADSMTQIELNSKYLYLLYPKIKSGAIDLNDLNRISEFLLDVRKHKGLFSKWPVSVKQVDELKSALKEIIAKTDFYSSKVKTHEFFIGLINTTYVNNSQFRNQLGDNKDLIVNLIQLLIADREVTQFSDIESIVDTLVEGASFYTEIGPLETGINVTVLNRILNLLLTCDHMLIKRHIRFDVFIQVVNQVDPKLLSGFNLTDKDLLSLKTNFFGGDGAIVTHEDIESLSQLIVLFETKNNFSIKSADPKKLLKYFTDPESVKVFFELLSGHSAAALSENRDKGLADTARLIFKLSTSVLKVKSELTVAQNSNEFRKLVSVTTSFVDELLQLPLFQNNGVLNLDHLKKVLKDSLDMNLDISEEILQLKMLILGGKGAEISRQNLIQLKQILHFISANYSEGYKYMYTLYFDRAPGYSLEQIRLAADSLKLKTIQLLRMTSIAKSEVTLNKLIHLLQPLLVKHSINIDLKLLSTGHQLLTGDHFDYSEQHFKSLVNTYVDLLSIVRYSQMGFIKFEIKDRNQFLLSMHAIDMIFKVFEESIAYQKGRRFETKHLDTLLTFLLKREIIPYKVSPELFIGFYKKMFNIVFTQPRVNSDQLEFISEMQFTNLKNEMILFKFFIHVLDAAFVEANYIYVPGSQEAKNLQLLNSISVQFEKFKKVYEGTFAHNPKFFNRALSLYKAEILQKKPIMFANGYVISHVQNDYFSSWSDQLRSHYIRTLARLLFQGWGNKIGTEINSQGLAKWYNDFKDFSVAIRNFDPRTGNSGERSMQEANLFTYSGNGDTKLNFTEATQYISLLMTGGSIQYHQIYGLLQHHKCVIDKFDPVGLRYINESCAIGVYVQYYRQIFSNMNWFLKYVDRLNSNQERLQFFSAVVEVSKNALNNTQHLESFDIRTINMILLYIESIFTVLDLDQNYTLSPDEIRFGYPRFQSLVYSVAVRKSESALNAFAEDTTKWICRKYDSPEENKHYLAREAFIYLIYNGKMPEKKDFLSWSGFSDTVGTAWDCAWNKTLFKFEGEVDRNMMINTFKLLKSVLASE